MTTKSEPSKSLDIFRNTTRNAELKDEYEKRVENAKLIAQTKIGKIANNLELLDFMLSLVENLEKEGLTRAEKNVGKVIDFIKNQMEINETDSEVVVMANGIQIAVNKRFISSSFVHKSLGISYTAVGEWFDNPKNVEMLEKHHKKLGLKETQNRLAAKASRKKAGLSESADLND